MSACTVVQTPVAHTPEAVAFRPAPQLGAALAPTGVLRVGVYPGSPSSLIRVAKDGAPAGIALELGQALARHLGVPMRLVEFDRVALVIEALKNNQIDFTFTNSTEARARDILFAPPLVRLELGYMVPAGSPLRTPDMIDQPGVRVGVTQGSTSQVTLGGMYKSATLRPVASLDQARNLLRNGGLEAFATNKGILFELAEGVPGARVLDGYWGFESLAMAISKEGTDRQLAVTGLVFFGEHIKKTGQLRRMIERAGMRGIAPATAP
jgi:polar amino acid transport system substrate-binding protein